MKKTIALFISISWSVGLTAQDFLNTRNELHAPANYFQKISPEIREAWDNPLFMNINVTLLPAPQNEPSVRISRVNPDIVVAAWRDFILGYQDPDIIRRIGYSYSSDGGMTWAPAQLLPDPNPDHESQSDPVVTSDMDGNFYISSTSRQPVGNYNREMLLYKSTDNGQTFALHATAVPGSGQAGEDKEWLFCDPVGGNATFNRLLMVWRSFGPSYGIKFRKSGVGGSDWSETVNVSDNPSGQGANVSTGLNGEIIVVWKDNGIYVDRSFDAGGTFGDDFKLSAFAWDDNGSFPFVCTDYSQQPTSGNIYVVWADSRLGSDDIWFQRSTDGGASWMSSPVRINDVVTNDQFWPAVQCDDDSRISVVYYDNRSNPGLYNAWLAWSEDAGNTWQNSRLSEASFYFNTPNSDVRFGDYIQVDGHGGKIIPVWTDDRAGGFDQEIFSAVIDLTTVVSDFYDPGIPSFLEQNFPNPFNGNTSITVRLGEPGQVSLIVTNSLGQQVTNLYTGYLLEGEHYFPWNNEGIPGIYCYCLTTGNTIQTRKMISIK